jgi:hypothetical protein
MKSNFTQTWMRAQIPSRMLSRCQKLRLDAFSLYDQETSSAPCTLNTQRAKQKPHEHLIWPHARPGKRSRVSYTNVKKGRRVYEKSTWQLFLAKRKEHEVECNNFIFNF